MTIAQHSQSPQADGKMQSVHHNQLGRSGIILQKQRHMVHHEYELCMSVTAIRHALQHLRANSPLYSAWMIHRTKRTYIAGTIHCR